MTTQGRPDPSASKARGSWIANRRELVRGGAAGLLSLLAAPAGAAPSPVGAVTDLRGSADAFLQSHRRVLEPASSVFRDDTVTTGAQSRLEIRLGGDTTLRLGEKGRVKIARFTAAGGTIILDDGAILVDKDPAGPTQSLRIDSSFGRIAVRGTRFFVGPSRGAFGVLVLRGAVRVEAAGRRVDLGTGEGTDIARRGAPPSPAAIWGAARVAEAMALID